MGRPLHTRLVDRVRSTLFESSEVGLPAGLLASRGLLAAHLGRKVVRAVRAGQAVPSTLRAAAAEAVFLEIACQTFGAPAMFRGRGGFFPHIFLPDFHGPHFEEALRRLVAPGRGPNILYFSLTGVCPCACEYCFAGAGGGSRADVGDAPVLQVAEAVAKLRVPLVNLSGGEPLARYERLLQTVRLLSEGCEVRVFTTGVGLTRSRLDELQAAGLKGVFVSLDGTDAAAFDAARGLTGAFKAAEQALRLCTAAGMLTFVNCVVDRQRFSTADEVTRFLRFIEAIDPRIVVNFLPQLATGRGTQADSFREPAECEAVATRIVDTAATLGRPVNLLFGTVDTFIGCPGAGGKLMNVDIEGNVTVCISRASLGNLLHEPFGDIYARFVDRCRRLKVGFFCTRVAAESGERLLAPEESAAALNRFYDATPDSTWQQVTDRYGWLLSRLMGAPAGGPSTAVSSATAAPATAAPGRG